MEDIIVEAKYADKVKSIIEEKFPPETEVSYDNQGNIVELDIYSQEYEPDEGFWDEIAKYVVPGTSLWYETRDDTLSVYDYYVEFDGSDSVNIKYGEELEREQWEQNLDKYAIAKEILEEELNRAINESFEPLLEKISDEFNDEDKSKMVEFVKNRITNKMTLSLNPDKIADSYVNKALRGGEFGYAIREVRNTKREMNRINRNYDDRNAVAAGVGEHESELKEPDAR